MYEIIKNIINAGGYALEKLLHKIDLYHLEDRLTDEQRVELAALAREKANAHDSYGAWQVAIDTIMESIVALEARVSALEAGAPITPEVPSSTPEEWVLGKIYSKGAEVTHSGGVWVSGVDNNVWEPGAIGVHDFIWKRLRDA